MENITVTLSSDLVQRAMLATGKRNANAAVAALVTEGIGNTPNATTARALRSKAKPAASLSSKTDIRQWLNQFVKA